ncbi:MAG: hypothetical protein ACREH9_08595 [Pseudomonadota bacterium]
MIPSAKRGCGTSIRIGIVHGHVEGCTVDRVHVREDIDLRDGL